MAAFQFGVPAGFVDSSTFSAALGVNAAGKLTDSDVGKAVKLIADSTYGLCADGNDIEGVLYSVEPATVNDGFGFGTILCDERFVGSNAGAGAIAVGAQVIAADQTAVGTALTAISSGVMTGVLPTPVKAGTGTVFKWRVISLLGGAGAVGTPILLERVK